ncbi:glycosyltransferase family protein [soil metagenome]
MKIFYAVQATGNGHIARAIELLPFLLQYGTVDIFLSGSNSNLQNELPVKYRSKGLSLLYHGKGGLDYWKMFKEISLVNAYKDARQLPVEKYDLVINDFEALTALACKIKKVASIGFGHQASFQSNQTPRPFHKEIMGEFILQKFAEAFTYIGVHFEQYDDFIFNPIIKQDILLASPKDNGYITVYLSHYGDEIIAAQLHQLKDIRFEVFSKKVNQPTADKNITFIPVSNNAFNKSMINCTGIITGAGFETPAEALYLRKKLLCLPIKGQYEQLCNAEALKQFDVPVIDTINDSFTGTLKDWLNSPQLKPLELTHSTAEIVNHVIEKAMSFKKTLLAFNIPG